jgi:hypothetical protein
MGGGSAAAGKRSDCSKLDWLMGTQPRVSRGSPAPGAAAALPAGAAAASGSKRSNANVAVSGSVAGPGENSSSRNGGNSGVEANPCTKKLGCSSAESTCSGATRSSGLAPAATPAITAATTAAATAAGLQCRQKVASKQSPESMRPGVGVQIMSEPDICRSVQGKALMGCHRAVTTGNGLKIPACPSTAAVGGPGANDASTETAAGCVRAAEKQAQWGGRDKRGKASFRSEVPTQNQKQQQQFSDGSRGPVGAGKASDPENFQWFTPAR